jgi:hypothetical protein
MSVKNSLLPEFSSGSAVHVKFSLQGISDLAKLYRCEGADSANFYTQFRDTGFSQTLSGGYAVTTGVGDFAADQRYSITHITEPSSLSLYVDGELFQTDTTSTTGNFKTDFAESFFIGNYNSAQHLFGYIEKISIYDIALTAQEVSLL